MERKPFLSLDSSINTDPEEVKVIQWEDFQQEVSRLFSLSSALKQAKEHKHNLQPKLQCLIRDKADSLNRSNDLEAMRQKLEARKLIIQNMSMKSKVAVEAAKKQEGQLSTEVRSILVGGTSLSVAMKRLQELNGMVAEERGYFRLRNLQKRLQLRQQFMVSQISLLYRMQTSLGSSKEQELESFPRSIRSGKSSILKPDYHGSLTILGLQLSMVPFTKISFFTDKKELQNSATALGYVAHAVSLIASYLQVPLRYPVRLDGSRSYINDYAPSIGSSSSDSSSSTLHSTNTKIVEFPLFLEGQDTTKAAYAVFLLNKDLEQLLNFIGVKSLGPRHVLANLKELLRIILSADYIDM